ncbi:hypothetical protein Hanom_Chr16g01417471 [Helianthus anomalus]
MVELVALMKKPARLMGVLIGEPQDCSWKELCWLVECKLLVNHHHRRCRYRHGMAMLLACCTLLV